MTQVYHWLTLFTCSLITPSTFVQTQVSCHDSQSCVSTKLRSNDTSDIECYGYRSCAETSSIISTAGHIYCYGSYSCHQSQNIAKIGTSDANINCYGLSSCAKSLISNEKGNINCYAEQSCLNTTMTNWSAFYSIWCSGDHSCAHSQIGSSGLNYLFGNLAGTSSIWYSNYTNTFYQFYGFESGYNATIICGFGHTCNVICAGNGCKGLNVTCITMDINSTCIINIDCTYAEYDQINCPHGYKYDYNLNYSDYSLVPMPSLINVTMSTDYNSHNPCNDSYINCGEFNWYCYSL